jgi:exopolyphosphatase/guanosine-5'-triphosphate,3'-diphosphate pyrophosphatase
MSTGIKKTKISKVTEKELLISLEKEKAEALNKIVNSSKISTLRKSVYLSSAGKYFKYADFLLTFAYKLGYVPIHPISTLNYYISTIAHDNHKDEVIRDCFTLMKGCDELWVFEEKLPSFKPHDNDSNRKQISTFAEGVLGEILWWLRHKKNSPIRFFTWKDVGIPKYVLNGDWQLTPKDDKEIDVQKDIPSRFGIIDLGSSTIKLTVSEVDKHNQISVLLKKSITTNLAEDFFETKMIKDQALERTIEGLKDLKDEAIEYGVSDFKLVGTKVLRDAKNASEVLENIEKNTDLVLEVLTEEKEIKYVAKAVIDSFDQQDKEMIIVNAGGGSSQMFFSLNGKSHEYSLPIGISDLNEKFVNEYPIKDEQYKEMKKFIEDIIRKNISEIPSIDTLVYTGGELDYMLITGFPLQELNGSISHPKKISKKDFKEYSAKMRNMTLEEIQSFMPNNPNWMNGAVASNTLLEVLSDIFKIKTIIPSNKNVNDGILLTMK